MSVPFPKPRLSLLLPALLLAGLLAGCRKKEAEEKTPPAPVKVARVTTDKGLEQWTELLGTTQPVLDRAGLITASVEGQVLRLGSEKGPPIREGGWVKKGDVIVELNATLLQANLAKLEDQKKQGDIAVQLAGIEVERLENLKDQKITVAASDERKARLALQDANLKKQAIATDQKTLEAQINLYHLRAPIDGKLGRIEVVLGQTLSVGTRVAEVVNLRDHVDVLCYVPPALIDRIQLGRQAKLTRAEADSPPGKVEFKGDQAQPETGNFPIKVRFPNGEMKLPANAVVRVQVLTLVKKNADTLPEAAVLEDQEPPVVVVVRKDEKEGLLKAYRIPVKVGLRDRANQVIEIEALLDPDLKHNKTPAEQRANVESQTYVIDGGNGLEDGDAVKVEEEKEKKE